jgi:hypothetical protein
MDNAIRKILGDVLRYHKSSIHSPKFIKCKDWYKHYKSENIPSEYSDYARDIEYDYQYGISKLSLLKTAFFASTSGSTGNMKIIPHSNRSLNNYFTSTFSLFRNLIQQQSIISLIGKNLLITGKSIDSFSPHSVPVGSISGRIASKMYKIAPFLFTYSLDKTSSLAPISRYNCILNSFNPKKIVSVIGTNPYIIHKFLSDRISLYPHLNNELVYTNLDKEYPNLKYIICLTGHPLKWHAEQLKKAFNFKISIYDPGVGASEGIFSSGGFSGESIGFPVIKNRSQFIEFKPLNEDPIAAHYDIRNFVGCKVESLITTDYGFKRYQMNDIYFVRSKVDKYFLEFCGKKEKTFSFASERINESNINVLFNKLASYLDFVITDFVFYFEKESGDLGRYVFLISTDDFRVKNFKKTLYKESDIADRLLQELNPEYRNSRKSNFLLSASLKIDNNTVSSFRTNKYLFEKQEKEVLYIKNYL